MSVRLYGALNYSSNGFEWDSDLMLVSPYNSSEKQYDMKIDNLNLNFVRSGSVTLIITVYGIYPSTGYNASKDYVYHITIGADPDPPVLSSQPYDILPYMSVGSGILFILGPGVAAIYWRHGRDLWKCAVWVMVSLASMILFVSTLGVL